MTNNIKELEARAQAYKLAIALEHLIYKTINTTYGHEVVRDEFTDAAWPLFYKE